MRWAIWVVICSCLAGVAAQVPECRGFGPGIVAVLSMYVGLWVGKKSPAEERAAAWKMNASLWLAERDTAEAEVERLKNEIRALRQTTYAYNTQNP